MKCRGCDKELIDGEDYKMVANWPFCPECFESLMKGPGKPVVEQPTEPPASKAEPAPQPRRCSVCKRQLGPEDGRKLGIWIFCPECYQELESFARTAEEGDAEPVAAEGADSETQAEEEPEGGVASMTVGLAKYISCARCGRRIPQGGSRAVDGEPYCPDCYYALVDQKERSAALQAPAEPGLPADTADEHGTAAHPESQDRCACCDRPLRPGSYDEREGFPLCRACLSTDPELAVRIAKDRHRKLLASIRERLDP